MIFYSLDQGRFNLKTTKNDKKKDQLNDVIIKLTELIIDEKVSSLFLSLSLPDFRFRLTTLNYCQLKETIFSKQRKRFRLEPTLFAIYLIQSISLSRSKINSRASKSVSQSVDRIGSTF